MRVALAVVSVAVGCDGCQELPTESEPPPEDGVEGECPGDRPCPFRDEWRVEIDAPFPYLDPEGEPQIGTVIIGRTEHAENFANRGDVIVQFTGQEGWILVEMRRFTMASNRAAAEEDFALLEPWAFDQSIDSPDPPDAIPNEADCSQQWREGCAFYVYYAGLQQLARSGADIRVTLPPSYRHTLEVTTEDNDGDADYHNRGNVCVEGLRGSAEIRLASGTAHVLLAEDAVVAPTCPEAIIAQCEANGWDSSCPCFAEYGGYGRVEIASDYASNIAVDVPSTLWTALDLRNDAGPGSDCTARVDVPGFVSTLPGDDPWRESGSVNQPPNAPNGHGFGVRIASGECGSVTTTESPGDFVGNGRGTTQTLEPHGNLFVCSGCAAGSSCSDLLPGG